MIGSILIALFVYSAFTQSVDALSITGKRLERLKCSDSACTLCEVVDTVYEGVVETYFFSDTAQEGVFQCDSSNTATFLPSGYDGTFSISVGECRIESIDVLPGAPQQPAHYTRYRCAGSETTCAESCYGKPAGMHIIGGGSVYCDGNGWALLQHYSVNRQCVYRSGRAGVSDAECGYLAPDVVRVLATSGKRVRLVDEGRGTAVSENAVRALVEGSNWHDTPASWDSNWQFRRNGCQPMLATGWPNMYQACGNRDGVHWMVTNEATHSSRYNIPSRSQTWLEMGPSTCPSPVTPVCVPATTCHPTECVLKGTEDRTELPCSKECDLTTLDCGGRCRYEDGKCKAFTSVGTEIRSSLGARKLERLMCSDSTCKSCVLVETVFHGKEGVLWHTHKNLNGIFYCRTEKENAYFFPSEAIAHVDIPLGVCSRVSNEHSVFFPLFVLWRGCEENNV